MPQRLQGRIAMVTGASSGIGAATARALLAEGARVIVTARRVERLRGMAGDPAPGGDRLLAIEADVTREADVERLVRDALLWSGGGLDMLVNNAGLSRSSVLEASRVQDLRVMVETNVLALAEVTRLAVPALRKSKGTLINIASSAAKSAPAGAAFYAATKAAVAVFSDALRRELAPDGVRVTTLFPGFVETEFFDALAPEQKAGVARAMAAMEALKAEDVADLILYVLTRPAHVSINDVLIRPTKQP